MKRETTRHRSRGLGVLLTILLGLAGAALAHEGHHHEAMGTVKAIEATKLELTTTDGKERSFVLTGTTKFRRGENEVKREDVTVGERAIVMYETRDGADRAIEIKLGEKKP
jgi:hypothetical protein